MAAERDGILIGPKVRMKLNIHKIDIDLKIWLQKFDSGFYFFFYNFKLKDKKIIITI